MNSASWQVTVGGGPCPSCGLDGEVTSTPGRWARLRGWLVDGQSPPSKLVCSNGREWPARSTSFLRVADGGWWRWPSKAMRVLMRHRTAEPVPLLWFAAALVGVVLGVAADLTIGWVWWLVTAGFLVLVWLVFLATALRYPGRDHLWIDLVATVSPQRAEELEKGRLREQLENRSRIRVDGMGGTAPHRRTWTLFSGWSDTSQADLWVSPRSASCEGQHDLAAVQPTTYADPGCTGAAH